MTEMRTSARRRTPAASILFSILLFGLVFAGSLRADDKDLLKRGSVNGNLLVIFGNSQTTTQPLNGAASQWDGDADSPTSKMGAAKRVIQQFVNERQGTFNIGLSSFSHNPNAGSISLIRKHWLYSPAAVDFPSESWQEPIGTVERWGDRGEGPCTSITIPVCTAVSPAIALSGGASVSGFFFGFKGLSTATVNLNASERILITLILGQYGDAFTDGTLTTYKRGLSSVSVQKVYQKMVSGAFSTQSSTPNGSPGTVTVPYLPAASLTPDLFNSADPDAGKAIGFLNDAGGTASADLDVNANCSGWEFQSNSSPQPIIKVPRDYRWGATCKPIQNSYPCVKRLLRPQATLVRYDALLGTYSTADHDNPGYGAIGNKYADGCDATLLGAVDAGLDVAENQVILETRNGSQAPLKNLLTNVLDYVNTPTVDGFLRGKRTDDPYATCRTTGVILIYDNFNGCQNDSCAFLTTSSLSTFKSINVPIYVVGLGTSASASSNTGICIAQASGAIVPQTGAVGYFPVTSPDQLYRALNDIASHLSEASKDFASASISSVQAGGDQMAYLATFNPAKYRSIWNGRINGYRLNRDGTIDTGTKTIAAVDDPRVGIKVTVPSNDATTLKWNAGANLAQTPGTGATLASAVLAPGGALAHGTYQDDSTDVVRTVSTSFYSGRKIVFSLPQNFAVPVTILPIANTAPVPEARYDLTASTAVSRWPTLKALLGPQTAPPAVLSSVLTDQDATNTLRFLWGDRDAVMGSGLQASEKYLGLKLGEIFHSNPVVIGSPSNFASYSANLNGYRDFITKFQHRRRVLFAGANDGLLHAFDVGAWNRDPSVCLAAASCYDLGTGAELFAYAPRAVLQVAKRLKDAVSAQNRRDEWTVDGSPAGADVYIDPSHNGTPLASNRSWQTVLVGGMREGSPFEGTLGVSPQSSRGSYYALDVTQPDELVAGASATGTFAAPKCLNVSGDATCERDWPATLWEISDTTDQDASGSPGAGFGDMGESWSKPGIGRIRVCTAACGTAGATLSDRYVAVFGGGFDRERKNRRGNWLYMVDIETGFVLAKANSSCGANAATGCTPVYFGSMPSEPALLDLDGDGIADLIYIGDMKGQLWRVDLSDLRMLGSAPTGRFENKIDFASGSARPFLFFQAPQSPASQIHPIYFRPVAVFLGTGSGSVPTLGLAFGTGDRDDITAGVDSTSLGYAQRYYTVVDDRSNMTRTEADLTAIASSSSAATTASAKGWSLTLINGERVITDSLAVQGYVYFSTFTPTAASSNLNACGNADLCGQIRGTSRFYTVYHANGNPYPGSSDRATAIPNATFSTSPVYYTSGDRQGHVAYMTDYGTFTMPPVTRRTSFAVKEWKEK